MEQTPQISDQKRPNLGKTIFRLLPSGAAAILAGANAESAIHDVPAGVNFAIEGDHVGNKEIHFYPTDHIPSPKSLDQLMFQGKVNDVVGKAFPPSIGDCLVEQQVTIVASDSICPSSVVSTFGSPFFYWEFLPVDPRRLPDGKMLLVAADVRAPYGVDPMEEGLNAMDNTLVRKLEIDLIKGGALLFVERVLYSLGFLTALEKIAPQLLKVKGSRRTLLKTAIAAGVGFASLAGAASTELAKTIKNRALQNVTDATAYLNRIPIVGDAIVWTNLRTAIVAAKLEDAMDVTNQRNGAIVMGSGHATSAAGIIENKQIKYQTIQDGVRMLINQVNTIIAMEYPSLKMDMKLFLRHMFACLESYEVYCVEPPKQKKEYPTMDELNNFLGQTFTRVSQGVSPQVHEALEPLRKEFGM